MDIDIGSLVAQILNFLILFFLFRAFLTKPIIKVIEDRRSLITKLENADNAYEEKIQLAKIQAREIIQEGIEKKDEMVAEAGILANKRKEEIIETAHKDAKNVLNEATEKTAFLEKELEENFVESVKRTAVLVLKKLIHKDPKIKEEYMQEVIKELKK